MVLNLIITDSLITDSQAEEQAGGQQANRLTIR